MPDPSGLYPAPPNLQPQGILAGNPLQSALMLQGLQRGNIDIQNLRSQQAVGGAFQSAINPDGTFNPNAALTNVRNDPNAAFAAPGAISTALGQQGNILDNRMREVNIATGQLSLGVANNHALNDIVAPLATLPKIGDEDVLNKKAQLVAAGVDPKTVAAANLRTVAKAAQAAKLAAAQNMGSAAANTPTPQINATGGGENVPLATTVGQGARPTSLSPQQTADVNEYTGDQTKSANLGAGLRPLQNALPLIEKLNDVTNFGPGSKQFTKLKAALVNTGVISPDTTDAAVRQEAGKYLLQNVTQAAGAGRSDEALNATMGSNPDADKMLKPAVIATIKNKIAMDRQDAALPAAANAELGFGKGLPQGYKTYKGGYYNNTDVRAFQFDLMSPQERSQLLKSLGPPGSSSFQRFKYSLDLAQKVGGLHSQADLNSLVPNAQSGGAQ